jgi:hypothetical protein
LGTRSDAVRFGHKNHQKNISLIFSDLRGFCPAKMAFPAATFVCERDSAMFIFTFLASGAHQPVIIDTIVQAVCSFLGI